MGRNKNQEVINRGRFSHGKEAIQIAENNKLRIRSNGGSHHIIYEPKGTEAISVPNHELGKGLGTKIFKWFIKWGLLSVMVWIIYANFLV